MRAVVQLNHARVVIESYDGRQPVNEHLREYCRQHKQIGSKDRRLLRNLVYSAFRLGHWRYKLPTPTAITLGYFLSQGEPDAFLEHWLPKVSAIPPVEARHSLDKKWAALSAEWGVTLREVFPLWDALSPAIDKEAYVKHLFGQLPVYAYPLNLPVAEVRQALDQHRIAYQEHQGTFQFPPETRLQALPERIRQHLVVQDRNSQQLVDDLPLSDYQPWWDCCAGAGGKSLRMKAHQPGLILWATDHRSAILKNLQQRIRKTGVSLTHVQEQDLTAPLPTDWPAFKGILLDAPCTGSGTWARTPERITQVDQATIQQFQNKQLQLIQQAAKALRPGGMLAYTTCSVFRQENEELINTCSAADFELERQYYYPGYCDDAENFYCCLLRKI
jgi:16S rRNA (cytosine967-C5)-methyltransferase